MKRTGFRVKTAYGDMAGESKMFHVSPRKPINKIGPKGQQWINVRKDIKKRFEWAGITVCEFRFEGCWFNDGLALAHCKKRRKIEGLEIWHCALACNHCHQTLDERMTHEEMHAAVHVVINKRGLIAPPAILQQIQEQAHSG